MITEYYILMGIIAVCGWLFILTWDEGIDAHREPEQDEKQRVKDLKEKLIQIEKDSL